MTGTTFNTENGDTLIVTLDSNMPSSVIGSTKSAFDKMFADQQLKILVVTSNISLDLIKSSNLDDNTDSELRKDNPALQDAWEQYQIVKNLAKEQNE